MCGWVRAFVCVCVVWCGVWWWLVWCGVCVVCCVLCVVCCVLCVVCCVVCGVWCVVCVVCGVGVGVRVHACVRIIMRNKTNVF